MGTCDSKKEGTNYISNNTQGDGLPPNGIIPQPVEVSNLAPEPNNNTTQPQNTVNNSTIIQEKSIEPVNSSIQPVSNAVNDNMKSTLPNISTQPENQVNTNIQSLPNTINNNLQSSVPNTSIPPTNQVNDINLGKTVAQTQVINNTTIVPNNATISQGSIPYNSNVSQHAHNNIEVPKERMYIVVQLPGREIEVRKLYDNNNIIDLESYIAPDTIDEFDFYDDKGYSINDLIFTPFKEWHDSNKVLRIKLIRSGLYIPNNIQAYIAKRTNTIGCLTFDKPNTFGLFIFNKLDNSTLSFEYSTNIYSQMKTVNQFSAYCNALNKLYISGGEIANEQATDAFLMVDLAEVSKNTFVPTQLCNLKKRRYWHSMIYIPTKYIYIVGGPNEVDVELYDIERNTIRVENQLNTERCEPSLILVNDKYLYAIFGFHLYDSFINSIERCNLHKRNRGWEMVEYKLNNTPSLTKAFFGVSYISNNIILISDKENQNDLKPNYLLSPGIDNIDSISDEGILNSRSTRLFAEKFFIPINENESINLAFKSGEPKIFIINNHNGNINELCLNESS